MQNIGPVTLHNLTMFITTDDLYVTINGNNSAMIAELAPEQVWKSSNIKITVSRYAPIGHEVIFHVDIFYNEGSFSEDVTMQVGPSPKIQIIYPVEDNPEGGLLTGNTYIVHWMRGGIRGSADIMLYRDDIFQRKLIRILMLKEKWNWFVTGLPEGDYKLRMRSTTNRSIENWTNPIHISVGALDPWIKVEEPNAFVIWQRGTTQSINWQSANLTGNVKISLMRDTSIIKVITKSVDINAGVFNWKVDARPGDYQIQVQSTRKLSVNDYSATVRIK